ncbi:MAG: 3-phosphoshikimate 1-carboxyvinyltransferase [Desulfovibrio sp.]|nr:3-phosphoshikimate 1-carboxyvinyltransferase [Desulfovibrio sp.]
MEHVVPPQDTVRIAIPGSKSLSHRYLIGAALAKGTSIVSNVQESNDVRITKRILTQLGAAIEDDALGVRVTGIGGCVRGGTSPMECDMGESGTSCRLLSAVLAAGNGLFRIFGQGRMHKRPIGELCTQLSSLGAGIVYTENPGYPPFLLQANGLHPDLVQGKVAVAMDDSSQYFSGLLLASPLCSSELVLDLGGRKAISWPYVGLTLQCLADFGIPFTVQTRPHDQAPWQMLAPTQWREIALVQPGCLRITVSPKPYQSGTFAIEGDWSNASYFLAAGALGQHPVTVEGLREDSLQGDRIILDILTKMGCQMDIAPTSVTVYPSPLHGVDLDMGFCPDLVPTVAVVASFAHGSTRIRNVKHLQYKESNRLQASCEELKKIDITIDQLSDGLLISGKSAHKRGQSQLPTLPADTRFQSHNDHRIAMSLAILDCINPNLQVYAHMDDPHVVDKSFPAFWEKWRCLVSH